MVSFNDFHRNYSNSLVVPSQFSNRTFSKAIERCISSIYSQIRENYQCEPQAVKNGNVFGFNVNGREAGRVRVSGRRISWRTYMPGKQPELPVFA